MQSIHIAGMADKLVKEGLVRNVAEAEAIASLTEYWKDAVAIVWNTTDVIRIGERIKRTIKEEQANRILRKVYKEHKPEYGITIFTIIRAIRKHL